MKRAMKKNPKRWRWVLYGPGVLFIVLLVIILAAPRLLNLDGIRKAMMAEASRQVGGRVEFNEIGLSIWPLPHLSIYQGRLMIPGLLDGDLEVLSVYPEIAPLFGGRIRVRRLLVDRPKFNLDFRNQNSGKGTRRTGAAGKSVSEKATSLMEMLSSLGGDLALSVRNGQLGILTPKEGRWTFQHVNTDITAKDNRITVDGSAASDFLKKMVLQGTLDLKALASNGRINLEGVNLGRPAAQLIPSGTISVGRSLADLEFKFRTKGLENFETDLTGKVPTLSLRRGAEEADLAIKHISGAFYGDKEKIKVSFNDLVFERPGAILSGRLTINKTNPAVELDISGKKMDVESIRQAMLKLAGDRPIVRQIFEILKGGQVSSLHYAAKGPSLDALGRLENMGIDGRLSGGRILVPAIDLEVTDAGGEVRVSAGRLAANHLSANYGKTRVSDGTLILGLSGPSAPFKLNIGLRADLDQLPQVLKKIFKDNAHMLGMMNRFKKIEGRAEGRLRLGDRLDQIETAVQVRELKMNAVVDPLPFPLVLNGRGISFAGTRLDVEAISSKLKSSYCTLQSTQVRWGEGPPAVDIASGSGGLDISELYPWLVEKKILQDALEHNRPEKGFITLNGFDFKGDLSDLSKSAFHVDGAVRDLMFKSDSLPDSLSISKGRFNLTPDLIKFTEFDTQFLDAALFISGKLHGYLQNVQSVELATRGSLGVQATRWWRKQVDLPPQLRIRPPLKISNLKVSWNRNNRIAIVSDFSMHDDIAVSTDLQYQPERLDLRKFIVHDQASRAEFTGRLEAREVAFGFKGSLLKSTADKFYADNRIIGGWIKGDLKIKFNRKHPLASVFEGRLAAEDISLADSMKFPLQIRTLSVEGEKDSLHLQADLHLPQDSQLQLNGVVNQSAEGLAFNADLKSNGLVLDDLTRIWTEKAAGTKRKADEAHGKKTFWDAPLKGIVHLDSASLSYARYRWRPFRADIHLNPEKIEIAVKDADLCGIATPGTLTILPTEIRLDVKPLVQNRNIQTTAVCLLDKNAQVEGSFDLSAHLNAAGPAADLRQSLQGDYELEAGKGRILSGRTFGILKDILGLINITEIFKGKLPNIGKEGFGYHSIRAKGTFEKNTVNIQESFIDGVPLNLAAHGKINLKTHQLDIEALAAPLKTVDSIVEKIPLIGYILGGTLITVPVRIRGDVDNPKVTLLSPSAIGEGLVGIMKRTFKLPIKIIEPFLKSEKK